MPHNRRKPKLNYEIKREKEAFKHKIEQTVKSLPKLGKRQNKKILRFHRQ